MDSKDAPGVLAVGACLAPIAGAEADITARQRIKVEDLIGVVGSQRNLRRADQVKIIFFEMVDVLCGLPEEAGTLHRLCLDQSGRDERYEAVPDRGIHREIDQGQLEFGALAGEVVEAGPRHLRPTFHIDRAEQLAELQMIFGSEALGGEVAGVPSVSSTT